MRISLFLLLFLLIAGCSSQVSNTLDLKDTHEHMHHMADISSEKQFIQEMIPHHQEAVDTSNQLLAKTSDPTLVRFLESVISMQTAEIDQMKLWYKDWYQSEYVDLGTYMPMMRQFSQLPLEEAQKVYIEDMIVHHLGAIKMANQLLELDPTRNELVEFAQAIISTQSDEIAQLRKMLN